MNIVLTNPDFYVELSLDEIKIFTKKSCSVYPVWLGKNRAIMREAIAYFQKNPPQSLFEALHIVGHFGLAGQGTSDRPQLENFRESDKTLDKDQIFW